VTTRLHDASGELPAWVRTTRGGRDPPGARKRGGRTRARIPPGHLRGDLRAEGRAPAGLAASRRPGQGGFFRLRAPSVVAPPAPPPGAPGFPINPGSAWVGCQYTSCSSASACTTCTCVADDAGAGWDCTDGGLQTEGDAQPTPYCALDSGPVDASDLADAGPIERCTEQYPTCSAPAPESPGWQCCRIATAGAVTELSCMPNDGAAPFPR
jgi:hypothetical protein